MGVYPGSAATKTTVVYIKRIFGFSMLTLFISSMFLFVFINKNDTVKISKTVFICLTFICSLIKTINFTINIKKFSSLEELLGNEIFYDKNYISMMRGDIGKTQRKVRAYGFLGIVAMIVCFAATPLVTNSAEHRLAIACYTPWDINNTLNYVLTYLLQCVLTAIGGLMNIVVEKLFASFCTIVCTELRALKSNLKTLDYSRSNQNIKSEMKRNMVLHKEIIKLIEAIEDVFSYGILGQFSTAIVIICFSGFRLASPSLVEGHSFRIVADLSGTFVHLVFVIGQVSIYCIYGHQVMVESSDINQAIYLSNWYKSDLSVRKDLIIIRERCKRPIIFTAGKLLPLTVNTFVMILRASYSFFAVIRQVN